MTSGNDKLPSADPTFSLSMKTLLALTHKMRHKLFMTKSLGSKARYKPNTNKSILILSSTLAVLVYQNLWPM